MKTITHFINNKITEINPNSKTSLVFNPATGENTAKVELSDEKTTLNAISVAQTAFESWKNVTPLNRARVMFKFKELIEANKDKLATVITSEHGKVFSDSLGELTRGIEVVEFACGIPHLLKGEHSLNIGRGIDSYSLMQPLGVCVGITPFNFPAMVPMWMFPIAIACGNSFILKPSEKDPSLAIYLAELLKQAGLPDGVFNVLNGDKQAVDILLSDPRTQAISFVGSTPIAKYVYSTGSAHGKRVQALGGAKNHLVVMPDANIEQTANALMGAAFGSAGERCMAVSVAVCVGSSGDKSENSTKNEVADNLIEHLKIKINKLKVGQGIPNDNSENDKIEADMGPLISKEHRQKVADYVQTGIDEGAKLIIDGRDCKQNQENAGYFIGATLFDDVKPNMTIYNEEIFGPVLSVVRVDSFAEAIKLINSHEFANGTAIFTENGAVAREFCTNIEVGMVGVNIPIPVPMAFHSFGGWKNSLFGSLHVYGQDGVKFYTRMKTITSRFNLDKNLQAEFSMPTMK